MIRVTVRNPHEDDEERVARRALAPLRELVCRRRDEFYAAAHALRKSRARARFTYVLLTLGVLFLVTLVTVVVAELFVDGLVPLIWLSILGAVLCLFAGVVNYDFVEDYADQRAALRAVRRAYDEALAGYVDAGGGATPSDALLLIDAGVVPDRYLRRL